MNKVAAIHQPNFFPWLGYFDKIIASDVFVFLDHVQFPKKGGAWCNRVKMSVSGEAKWITASIVRNYHGTRAINEMEFQASSLWRNKIIKTISANYCKASHYESSMELIEPLIMHAENNVAEFNTHAILAIIEKLDIPNSKIFRSSKLDCDGASNALLVSLTKLVGCNTYMCGGGASGYQDEDVFLKNGIQLKFQNFTHPRYEQTNSDAFISGLSILDAFMNLGFVKTRNLFIS